jgi:hypothetical protein
VVALRLRIRRAFFSFRRLRLSPAGLARRILQESDVDVRTEALPFFERLARIVDELLRDVETMVAPYIRRLENRVTRVSDLIAHQTTKLTQKRKARKYEIEQAELWNSIGIKQHYPLLYASLLLRVAIGAIIGVVDYYIFAEAWSVLYDYRDYSRGWWLGGLLGLLVLLTGWMLAHQLKTVAVGHAQKRMLREIRAGERNIDTKVEKQLVPKRPQPWPLLIAILFFGSLTGAGIGIRANGTGSSQPSVYIIIFQGLIPFLIVFSEFFMYDPLDIHELGEPPYLRFLRWRKARAKRSLAYADEFGRRLGERVLAYYEAARAAMKLKLGDLAFDVSDAKTKVEEAPKPPEFGRTDVERRQDEVDEVLMRAPEKPVEAPN